VGEEDRVRDNAMKARWREGAAVLGGWCAIPSHFSAEIVASSGVGYVCVDMQHGLADLGDMVAMLQAIGNHGPTPLVRVPPGDLATAQRALDAGAEGVIFPLISTAAQALDSVTACRYPPQGGRSFGPIRARMHLGADVRHANEQVACIVMIETLDAVDNLAAIIDTGVDAVYVGPNDLALALGLETGSRDPRLETTIQQILDVCRRRDLPAGIHTTSGAAAARWIEQGFRMVTVSTDAGLLTAAYRSELDAAGAVAITHETGVYG
jgi:4-hydroxy-2-oxoheptanedioate aldolase